MPIIQIPASAFMQRTIVPKDWYETEVVSYDGPKKSADGNSLNLVFTMRIKSGKYAGKEKEHYINSWGNWCGILPLLEACEGKKLEPQDLQFDPEKIKGKIVKAEWVEKIMDDGKLKGQMVNNIENFLPLEINVDAPW